MQSHPTNNTKLYRSSQLLHQHSERSRQQHDFSSMAAHPNPSHPLPRLCLSSGAPSRVGGGAPALPLQCQSVTEIMEAAVVAELALWWHKQRGISPGWEAPWATAGQGSQPGGKGETLTTAGLGLPLSPSAPRQALLPPSAILGSSSCREGGMSPLFTLRKL